MTDPLTFHLQLVGASQLVLALAHATFGRRFDWARDLAPLTLLNRQVFYVHTFFVALVVGMMGALGLFGTAALRTPSPLGAWVAGGLTLFWLARWYCQFFYYSPQLWRGHRFYTIMHGVFGLVWAWYVAVYGWLWAGYFAAGW